MKKEYITQYGNFYTKHSIEKVPKFVLQCYMKFLGIEIRKGTKKKTLCDLISKYQEYEKNVKNKKIPLHQLLEKESKDSRENRLCGGKFTEKDWKKIGDKIKRI